MDHHHSEGDEESAVTDEFLKIAGDVFISTEEAIRRIGRGEQILVVDDEDRENEGDLIFAADAVTPEAINFMARFGRGLICVAMTSERCDELELPLMVEKNTSAHETAFTVSVEATRNTTTGISAHDRAETVRVLADPTSGPRGSSAARPHVPVTRPPRRSPQTSRPYRSRSRHGADGRSDPGRRPLRGHG